MTAGKRDAATARRFIVQVPQDRLAWLAALLTSVELLLLPFVIHLDGKAHAGWEQFLGRFHPLAVHLPIGLIVLVPVLEIAGAYRPALREAAGFVLAVACAACLGSLTLGYLLAHGSGDAGDLVRLHMWGGIALSIGMLFCILARPSWASGSVPRVYPAMLVCLLGILVWTAHEGGSITHGSNYLTEYMPTPMKRVLAFALPQAAVRSDSFFAMHINPIFDSNCVACHGPSKMEGGLRLDSYALLMQGGKDGPVIEPGRPEKSLLIERVTLPASDKHAMPAEGRPPLRPEEIARIRAWIQQNASATDTTVAGISMGEEPKELLPQPVDDYSGLMAEIREMDKGLGAKLVPVSGKPSDGLVLQTVDVAASFGDAQLAQLKKFSPYIVDAELGRTTVTDASLDTLAGFTHLRALHLEGTAVTGDGLGKLAPLTQLTYLNLSGTKVTQSALLPLASMKNLRHIYLFDTPAQPAPPSDANPSAAQPAK